MLEYLFSDVSKTLNCRYVMKLLLKPEKRLQEESEMRLALRTEAIRERLALEEKEKLERLQAPEDQSEEISEQSEDSIEKSKT